MPIGTSGGARHRSFASSRMLDSKAQADKGGDAEDGSVQPLGTGCCARMQRNPWLEPMTRPINPDSAFKFRWDILLVLATMYSLFLTPFELSFGMLDELRAVEVRVAR
jgi:hypothetical protein